MTHSMILVEMDEDEEIQSANTHTISEETTVADLHSAHPHYSHVHVHTHTHAQSSSISQPYADVDPGTPSPSPPSSSHVFHPPTRHPSIIFSFPTPTAYSAPPNPTLNVAPIAYGSTSELFKCIVKKPEVVQLEINGEMQSNASDVTTQFLAELRVYTTVTRHRNIVAFFGCLEGVGMVLEYVEGKTLFDVINLRPELKRDRKIDFHNQLLDGLAHLHSFGLSHGDMSLTNIYVTASSNTIKLFDFGRSVAADSFFNSPSAESVDPFNYMLHPEFHEKVSFPRSRTTEQIHRGTRPFTAPEILRGECTDALLADAYSFGIVLVCLDKCALVDCDPEIQSCDIVPKEFLEGCSTFSDRIIRYIAKIPDRRRILKEDRIPTKKWWDD